MAAFSRGNSANSDLTGVEVEEMRFLYWKSRPRWTQSALAHRFNLSVGSVQRCVNGLTHRDKPGMEYIGAGEAEASESLVSFGTTRPTQGQKEDELMEAMQRQLEVQRQIWEERKIARQRAWDEWQAYSPAQQERMLQYGRRPPPNPADDSDEIAGMVPA